MPATRYARCKELLRSLLKKTGPNVSLVRLRKEIIRNIGASEYRVVRSSCKMMLEMGLIKDCGNHFEINERRVNE